MHEVQRKCVKGDEKVDGEDVEVGDSPWQVMPRASMGRLVVLRREQQDVEVKNNKMLDLGDSELQSAKGRMRHVDQHENDKILNL